jgi:amidohydrolase
LQVVLALQTIRSRTLSPLEPSVVTVGIVRGGTRFNIIPGEVHLAGTARTYSTDAQNTVERRMREILSGQTAAAGATYELEYERVTPPTVNDVVLTRRMIPALERAAGQGHVRQIDPWMAGEDFAFYAQRIPGFFFMLGSAKPGVGSGDHHSPTFMADDGAIPVGVRAMVEVVLGYLEDGGRR